MAGLRGQDEIDKAFAGLEYAPGSKKKRRDIDPKVSRRRTGETNGWDANPIKKTLSGVETEVFTIGALAQALEKQIVTIRLWERKGYIPRAPYRLRAKTLGGKKTGGNRVYTRALIEATIDEFAKRGLIGSSRVEWNQHDDLTEALVSQWKAITSTESQ
ncbi:hypothetical protein UFOVP964_51 [uncultured Caudovirales phage]|uniref:HTH merR-type domain-containing protein n=1 Tax=uncultured Caudovirales phage TaxID=2100421 RepID=A0A6J5R6I1_9CAUD|nr:hypothetical protein UFOVP854_51 [uncultured Caudovirales phage]CAB4174454.1 hypothetical protein UFOVP964_51 [uncultured Caudovirales phage]CAB4179438.1 hypothetical protein UFOVP1034_107 [uncultured Caudovirales phage]CAB4189151.1 hypothetical protein UFOVP1177_107 [uncultured Caudovirales phage]CAB4193511.1 hypothetical protein UFOVP1243_94 [uncultured Caudovirales phage]